MSLDSVSEFRDPIHGFVDIYPHERQIVDTREFQRLRRIRQLGLTHYVYHGAEHSRFGHAIGVMHLAGKAVEKLLSRKEDTVRETLGWQEHEVQGQKQKLVLLARLAGLLHDVGHAPFSHTGEARLFAEGDDHENHGASIIRNTEIGAIIDSADECQSHGIKKEEVADLVVGKATLPAGFVQELISSTWDVDKMDYLLRDSHYCGVQYGTFDLDRILNSFTLDAETDAETGSLRLAIDEGGVHALEAFVLARYYMFTQVYFHDVRRGYDLVLTDFISELLSDEGVAGRYPGTDRLRDYLEWDDYRILNEARRRSDEGRRNLAWRVNQRQHPKSVYETDDLPDSGVVRMIERKLIESAQSRFPECSFWLDKAIDHPDRFRRADMMVEMAGSPTIWREFRNLSKPLQGLEEINKYRLYADVRGDSRMESEVREYCRAVMASV